MGIVTPAVLLGGVAVGGVVGFAAERATAAGQIEEAKRFDAWYKQADVPAEFSENVQVETKDDALGNVVFAGVTTSGIAAMVTMCGAAAEAPRFTRGAGAVALGGLAMIAGAAVSQATR